MFATLAEKLRAQLSWRKLEAAIAKMRPHCLTEIEQDEEHCLDAMHHWHSPVEWLNAAMPTPCSSRRQSDL